MMTERTLTLADAFRTGVDVSGVSDWVSALVGFLGLAGVIYTGWRASRTEERGQDLEHKADLGANWERLTEGMWKQIHDDSQRISKLEDSDRTKSAQIDLLTEEVARLKRWKEAALRYIAALISTITTLGGTPPDPPADYTDH